MIQTSLAGILHQENRLKEAIRYLRAAEMGFPKDPEAHRFYCFQGRCLEEDNNLPAARTAWERGAEHAHAVGDRTAAAEATAALAGVVAKTAGRQQACAVLRRALRTESLPGPVTTLLRKLLEIQVEGGNLSGAIRTLTKIQESANTPESAADAVDCHMRLGDALWSKTRHLQALQAYMAATGPACQVDLEALIRIGGHIVQKLLTIRNDLLPEQISGLESSIRAWLPKQAPYLKNTRSLDILLWPFRVARRVASSMKQDGLPSLDRLIKYMSEEIQVK